MALIEKCGFCGGVADGYAWIDDIRYCHGDDVEVTCFMREQWASGVTPAPWFEPE